MPTKHFEIKLDEDTSFLFSFNTSHKVEIKEISRPDFEEKCLVNLSHEINHLDFNYLATVAKTVVM